MRMVQSCNPVVAIQQTNCFSKKEAINETNKMSLIQWGVVYKLCLDKCILLVVQKQQTLPIPDATPPIGQWLDSDVSNSPSIVLHNSFNLRISKTRRYRPLRWPTSSSCGEFWSSPEAFFALWAKKNLLYYYTICKFFLPKNLFKIFFIVVFCSFWWFVAYFFCIFLAIYSSFDCF